MIDNNHTPRLDKEPKKKHPLRKRVGYNHALPPQFINCSHSQPLQVLILMYGYTLAL